MGTRKDKEDTNLDVSEIVALDGRNTTTIVEFDLPYTAEIGQEIADTGTCAYIPHLQGSIRPRDDLLTIVLEASDGTRVCTELVLAMTMFGIPDPKCGIGRGRDKVVILQREKTDKRCVAIKVIQK